MNSKDTTLLAAKLALALGLMAPPGAMAGEAEAKNLLKAMSDYLASQKAISFTYDSNLEVVTGEHQKLLLASSGKIELGRPDKLRATRFGGFANVEMVFDGKTVTLLGKDTNLYTQVEVLGTVENLVDEMREKLRKPVPGADLLLPDAYDRLLEGVTDVKDLGSGVIGGVECDHLAFRAKNVDWQIWIAQGDTPRPCRYVITASQIDEAPQYSIQISDWKTSVDVAAQDYSFANATGAKRVEIKDLANIDELPDHLTMGDGK
ncbi:DUF2092 domain-containing protein [Sinorhizobium sp. NFACC03]|uniref:DUF2092 domain-containing protein n=1 Tax=Sinorhizobium sp. NFACC03 TaxID=1566295 RepID=UPI0008881D13|nr:DUF2092 domain-containing protein [Sinorhizobium sp. NFACC03]SDA98573.1 hypothetical protein SAMN03159448_06238 [Sinorhizobium sp. NFACC03]